MKGNFNIQFEDTFTVIQGQRMYNFDRCIEFILERGKAMYGGRFLITTEQRSVYHTLLIYAIQAKESMDQKGLEEHKGLLLMGPPGSGKSAMMQLIKPFFSRKHCYEIRNCKVLTHQFCESGFMAISSLKERGAKPLCLDQFGNESIGKFYGVNENVANCLIEHFYEGRFDQKYPKLHLTTSLGADEISDRYGEGVRRMLKEMCNVVVCV